MFSNVSSTDHLIETLATDNAKLRNALREIAAYNPVHNDREAFIDALIKWALGDSDDRPSPAQFGIV